MLKRYKSEMFQCSRPINEIYLISSLVESPLPFVFEVGPVGVSGMEEGAAVMDAMATDISIRVGSLATVSR